LGRITIHSEIKASSLPGLGGWQPFIVGVNYTIYASLALIFQAKFKVNMRCI
jgi:hypothetical protein